MRSPPLFPFFFNDTATTEIYTLSLHDALPISRQKQKRAFHWILLPNCCRRKRRCRIKSSSSVNRDRSTRLNSSHSQISYAVFCLKKKKKTTILTKYTRNICICTNITTVYVRTC